MTAILAANGRVYHKGRINPPNMAERYRLSWERHGHRMMAMPHATQASFDCVAQGWCGPVKDQSQCGSCWDFSGIAVCEGALYKAGYAKPDGSFALSEQYILDCTNNGGCGGDDNTTVLDACKSKGVPTTADYGQYGARANHCHIQPSFKLYQIADWGFVGPQQGVADTQAIKDAMVLHGPIGCAVAADDAFVNYQGGVWKGSGSRQIDHDVVIVGWDDATQSWKVRNSWGVSWGEQGYIRMVYGANEIGTEAVWAQAPGSPHWDL